MTAQNRIGLESPELVGQQSQHVLDVKDQIWAQLGQLVTELEPLSTRFTGSAGTAFQNLKAEFVDRESGLDAVLGEVAAALAVTHNNYVTGEDEGAQDQRTVMAETATIATRINPRI